MNLYNSHKDLIKHLRSLAKTGQTSDPNSKPSTNDITRVDISTANALIEAMNNITLIGKDATTVIKSLNEANSNLQTGLSYTAKIVQNYNNGLVKIVRNATLFDEIETSIAKTLGITTKQSIALSAATDKYIAKLKISREQLDKYRATFESILPGQSKNLAQQNSYNEVLFESQDILQNLLGLSEKQSAEYMLYTEGSGKNIASQLAATEKLADTWDKATGQVGSYKYILNTISSLSAGIRKEFSRLPGNLERAVLKSKHLGVSMEQLSKVGSKMLNIEQSVSDEIEFQLITGKRFTDASGNSLSNRIREAKVLRDSEKLAEAMNDLMEEHGEMIRTADALSLESYSTITGLSVDELAYTQEKYDLTKKIAETSGKSYKDFVNLPKQQQQEIQVSYEASLSKSATEDAKKQLEEIQTLKKKEIDLKSPADRTVMLLQSIIDDGIRIKRDAQYKNVLDETRPGEYKVGDDADKALKKVRFSVEEFVTGIKNIGIPKLMEQEDAIYKVMGYQQTYNLALNNQKTALEELNKFFPAANLAIKTFMELIQNIPGVSIGIEAAKKLTEPSTITGVAEDKNKSTVTTATSEHDALIVNDGLIKFHPSDKFMRVNDSAMIAGTSVDGNKKLASAISGGGMDMGKLVQAIQTAFAGVSVTVNVDPMQIDREIKFRTATINV